MLATLRISGLVQIRSESITAAHGLFATEKPPPDCEPEADIPARFAARAVTAGVQIRSDEFLLLAILLAAEMPPPGFEPGTAQ